MKVQKSTYLFSEGTFEKTKENLKSALAVKKEITKVFVFSNQRNKIFLQD